MAITAASSGRTHRGRPIVNARVDEAERIQWHAAAAAEGITLADLIRESVRERLARTQPEQVAG